MKAQWLLGPQMMEAQARAIPRAVIPPGLPIIKLMPIKGGKWWEVEPQRLASGVGVAGAGSGGRRRQESRAAVHIQGRLCPPSPTGTSAMTVTFLIVTARAGGATGI